MNRAEYIGAARAFHDLGFSPGQVKIAFIKQGMSPEDADLMVKEAWVGLLKTIGTAASKVVPWLARTFGSKAGGAAAGTLTKGLAAAKNPVSRTVASGLHNVGQSAATTASQIGKSPVRGLAGEAGDFVRANLFMGPRKATEGMAPGLGYRAGQANLYHGMVSGMMPSGGGGAAPPPPQQAAYPMAQQYGAQGWM